MKVITLFTVTAALAAAQVGGGTTVRTCDSSKPCTGTTGTTMMSWKPSATVGAIDVSCTVSAVAVDPARAVVVPVGVLEIGCKFNTDAVVLRLTKNAAGVIVWQAVTAAIAESGLFGAPVIAQMEIFPRTLGPWTTGQPVNVQMTVIGGASPYTWEEIQGQLEARRNIARQTAALAAKKP